MHTENLIKEKAKEKMTRLAKDIRIAMLVTGLRHKPLSVIPMKTKKVDKEGNIWFLNGLSSDHNPHIVQDPDVQLIYSDTRGKKFLSIFGVASIVTDANILKELYEPKDDKWFTGVEDPNLIALKISPRETYYWEDKNQEKSKPKRNILAAVSQEEEDLVEKGKLKL